MINPMFCPAWWSDVFVTGWRIHRVVVALSERDEGPRDVIDGDWNFKICDTLLTSAGVPVDDFVLDEMTQVFSGDFCRDGVSAYLMDYWEDKEIDTEDQQRETSKMVWHDLVTESEKYRNGEESSHAEWTPGIVTSESDN